MSVRLMIEENPTGFKVRVPNAVSYFAVFLCGLATWRERLLYEKAISRKDAKNCKAKLSPA